MEIGVLYEGATNLHTIMKNGHCIFSGKEKDDFVGARFLPVEDAVELAEQVAIFENCLPWKEISEDEWWEALEVMPPEQWKHCGGIEFFRWMEYLTGRITSHYARSGHRYFTANRLAVRSYAEYAKEIREII